MLKYFLAAAALVVAGVPAAYGLAGNDSFTRELPVRVPEQAQTATPTDAPTANDDGTADQGRGEVEPGDDHGGDVPRDLRTEAGDDHGTAGDDEAEPGDDDGGTSGHHAEPGDDNGGTSGHDTSGDTSGGTSGNDDGGTVDDRSGSNSGSDDSGSGSSGGGSDDGSSHG
jgi:hypothetical protein